VRARPPEQRWPVQLARLLGEEGYSIGEPRIVARTGWTTGELEAAIQEEELAQSYDLVSLLIGVNNQYGVTVRRHTARNLQTCSSKP